MKECMMIVPVSIVGPSDGEFVLNDGKSYVRIIEDGSTTAHRLGVIEILLAPQTLGPPQHRHAEHEEGFFIVSGAVRFTVGEDNHDAGPGTFVMVPIGAPHTFANAGDEPARIISTITPDKYVNYFRDRQEMLKTGGGQTREEIGAIMAAYATELSTEYAG
jgi:quercetin dioxygenase-like cupin family protein